MVNQFGFKRKNSNKVLFHFDSLVDLHLAVVYALQKDYPSGGSVPSINYSFLHQSHAELKSHRVYDIGTSVIQECFNEPLKDKWEIVYLSYKENQFDRIIQDAPITLMLKLIAAYSRVGRGTTSTSIFCENEAQLKVARGMIKTLPANIIMTDPKNVDLNQYARFIIGDINDLKLFNKPKYTHLAVLNYGSNLQISGGITNIPQKYVKLYGFTNQFEIIDAYRDVQPLKEKET